jgi:hypothetical protein
MADRKIPTQLERNLATAEARAEFEARTVAVWLKDLRGQGLGLALPALILKLDALSKADVHPLQRAELLRLFKRPVLRALASLPKPIVAASGFAKSAAYGVTLEQRLLLVMEANYRQALHDLSKVEYSGDTACADARSWVIRNLFYFTERQIRYGIDWKVTWPPGTWQALHDLHILLSTRDMLHVLVATPFDVGDPDLSEDRPLDPNNAYKRLLLLGLASQLKPGCCDDPVLAEHLDAWAAESRLDEPEARVWDLGVYVVEVAKDAPPKYRPGVLEDSFHGWVLEPAEGLLALVGRGRTSGPSGFHPV